MSYKGERYAYLMMKVKVLFRYAFGVLIGFVFFVGIDAILNLGAYQRFINSFVATPISFILTVLFLLGITYSIQTLIGKNCRRNDVSQN